MKIEVLRHIEGAKKARGVAVVIDVFRAFSFECYAVNNNAKAIIPVASKEVAYGLKQANPGYLLAGERHGVMLPGFDYGNSPSQIENADLTGKTIVHTTSAGTQGLEAASGAEEILTGSLVNARAIANYILAGRYEHVSLVSMGIEGVRPAEEDDLCAEYIKRLLEGRERGISAEIDGLKRTSGKKFFDASQSEVFPERDFHLCTQLNKFNFVLRFKYGQDGLGYIENVSGRYVHG